MRLVAALTVLVASVAGCSPDSNPAPAPRASPVTERLVQLTGSRRTDCGIFYFGEPTKLGWQCAIKTDAQQRPFWLALDSMGVDSKTWVAIGRDRYRSRFFLMASSGPNGETISNPRITVIRCKSGFSWPKDHGPGFIGCSTAP